MSLRIFLSPFTPALEQVFLSPLYTNSNMQ